MIIQSNLTHQGVRGFQFGASRWGKPRLYVYLYFVDGLLIDTGQRMAQREILKTTADLPIDQIFITHHHEDHSGNISAIAHQKNASTLPVLGSLACAEKMKSPPPLTWAQKLTWGSREAYAEIQPAENEIQTPHHTFQIIPIPGHASDMVALYEPEKKWLFSADLYINHYISYFLHNESIAQQIESIDRVLALDFDVMFCNHRPILKNPKDALLKKRDFLRESTDHVLSLHQRGLSENEIFRELKKSEDWKEDHLVKFLSGRKLSKQNMVKAILRDI
ncbi:MAG: MBL fold metallo-hydrolase [Schleiferiaceae bacterium]